MSACSSDKYLLLYVHDYFVQFVKPMFAFKGKNVVGSFLPFTSLNIHASYFLMSLFCSGYHTCL